MMGVKKKYEEKNAFKYTGIKGFFDILNVILRMTYNFVSHNRNIKKFREIYNKEMDYFNIMLRKIYL